MVIVLKINKMNIIGYIDLDNEATINDVTLEKWKNGWHEFSVPFMISREKAADLQADLSYHPAGYGLYDFNATPTMTTWKCACSCD